MLKYLYKSPTKNAYIIILTLAIFSTFYNAFLPLHGDEAYYWVWSHHLQTGYFDHPPMIAFLIHLTNYISEAEWGVRLVNVFSMSISAIYIFRLTREISDEKTALDSILIFCSVILVHAGYILTTTDAPLILFWTLTLYYSYKAFFYNTKKDYILAGVFLGFMMLSKYTAIIFVIFLVLFIVIKKRTILRNKNFYVAVFISFFIVLPMVWWNYKHDWVSFAFQLTYRGGDGGFYPHLFFEFFGGQFGIFSPVFTAIFFFFMAKERLFFRDEKLFFIALSSVTILLFFFYKSFFTRMELNFAAPAYIGGAILSAYIFNQHKMQKTFKVGLGIALFFTVIARVVFITHLEVVQDRMYGKREAVQTLQHYAKEGDAFYGDHLTLAAYLKYYLPNHPDTDVITKTRFSQYDMWREKNYLKDGLVLAKDEDTMQLKQLYHDVKLLKTINIKIGFNGKKTNTIYIYRVSNAKD
jgi:4-amino-4-deoxy-L-arabinose transferase-like glycosyltransferase